MIRGYHFVTSKNGYFCLARPFQIHPKNEGISNFRVLPSQELEIDGDPKVGEWGLHVSEQALDALYMAPDLWLCLVECSGKIDRAYSGQQLAAQKRKILAIRDGYVLVSVWLEKMIDLCALNPEFKLVAKNYLSENKFDYGKTFENFQKTSDALLASVLETFVHFSSEEFSALLLDNFKIALKKFLIQNQFVSQKQRDELKEILEKIFSSYSGELQAE